MKLQIAADKGSVEDILRTAEKVHDVVDIFEVGTPVIMNLGMEPVRQLKKLYPDMTVLADSKIVDAGAFEAEEIFRSGADIATVLAVSDDATIREAVETAKRMGGKVMADLICVRDIAARAALLIGMGVDIIAVHTGVDMQAEGRTPLRDLEELVSAVPLERTAVAGGINMKTLPLFTALKPGIIIAGGALLGAPDVRAAAAGMKAAMAGFSAGKQA